MSIRRALTKIKHERNSRSPCRSLSGFFHDKEFVYSSDDINSDDSEFMSKNEQKRRSRQKNMRSSPRFSEDSRTGSDSVRGRDDEPDSEEMKARYGDLPVLQSKSRPRETYSSFDSIASDSIGKEINFRARVHVVRRMGPKLVFIVFRQQLTTFQGVLEEEPEIISGRMVRWALHIPAGSIVKVKGILKQAAVPVIGSTIHAIELQIRELHVLVRREEPSPFSVYEAELATAREDQQTGRRKHIPDKTRLANRILDLRTDTSQSIFRIQSAIGNLFRSTLDAQGFIEIHTPKLQASATESGASVFSVSYFTRTAYLAQSPQLAKQMAIASDFERVYEIGAVFRAENSNTHRHLTEYTGLDIEMAINEHYHEALETIDAVIKEIFKGIYGRYRREIEVVKQHFPHEDLVWLDQTPILRFSEAIKLLNDSGWVDDSGNLLSDAEDLGTRDEIRLGELVKEKYHTDYYILDKFPVSARPFYTMIDPEDNRFTNSFDIFVRGQEIVSGGQRVHDRKLLEERMKKVGIDPTTMDDYMEGFGWGAPPHAGAGIGLERLLMLILSLGNIRLGALFPRDPKSFPPVEQTVMLRHPEASTLHPPWEEEEKKKSDDKLHNGTVEKERQYQSLEDLIANYGDATSTSWPDERYRVWRDYATGAAVSYVPSHGYAIIAGDPLCDTSQYTRIVIQFLRWLKAETSLKPIWLLCSPAIDDILGDRLGWRSLSCVSEERVDPMRNLAASDGEIARKIRRAENEGVKITQIPSDQPIPEDLKSRIDARIKDWQANRSGTQIYLSGITPWRDQSHRQYFYATERDGTICSFVVLAQLAPRNGLQIKYSLDFSGSPSGSIESILTHAIQTAAKAGVKTLTFGSGASTYLTPGHNMGTAKAKVLQTTYDTLARQFKLNRKTEFRTKIGAHEDPVYIAYPKRGLGTRGIRAILDFFED
ncbi:aspartate-tRNA(Asn) ligase [Polytolypa hystricis UAMH7299]|uniref:aspartate--tRNA ligase n=1 Tax=Polytolypa hystricis (strain UAMH7299) TaxID=1447883 RepID=A0A2B7WEQ6_POLH7|nr:aspartate-tRNA(Asn) ligase [Polytolypa hystricis UAMH7299]